MSKKKNRRARGAGEVARRRAQEAIAAGDAREAERWARLAGRIGDAPEDDEPALSDQEIRNSVMEKMDAFVRGEEERAEVARSYDCRWWEEVWNEVRDAQGLPELPLTPLLQPYFIAYAQAHPPEDLLKRGVERWRKGQIF